MSVNDITDRQERPPYVVFEVRTVEDKKEGLRLGRYVARDVDYALVTPAYTKDCVVNTVDRFFLNAESNAKNNRIPNEWLEAWRKMYAAWKNGQEMPLDGTPIKGWGVISPAQQEMLIRMSVHTVEDLAGINDEGMRRYGMGGLDLKNKAKNWLASIKDHGPTTMKLSALEKENENLTVELNSLKEKMDKLLRSLPTRSNSLTVEDAEDEEPKPRRGRKPNVERAVEV